MGTKLLGRRYGDTTLPETVAGNHKVKFLLYEIPYEEYGFKLSSLRCVTHHV